LRWGVEDEGGLLKEGQLLRFVKPEGQAEVTW
jgi:hypothetical protein